MDGPRVESLRVRGWRSYAAAEVRIGPGLTVVHGPNGAGKTNLLEALYFGLTGRSCRTGNEREVVAFDASAARVEVETRDRDGTHELAVGFQPGEAKRFRVDGAPVERLADTAARPLVSVFLPDRLELVKGPPALRRSHLDQVVAALWPARVATRRAYSQALAQRNALLSRVRRGIASRESLHVWDAELARHGTTLRADRSAAVASLVAPFAAAAEELGLSGEARLEERPRARAADADELAAELATGVDSDLERGFTGRGPHRDDLVLLRDARELRAYGSQGEQRRARLALLLAEREALAEARGGPPLLLLDDVMSELDASRRERLVERIGAAGQARVTTTDLGHVPGAASAGVTRIAVRDGT
ncbi:MAG TPA: DNA replication and repair protein RecF, partial [Solirubrobacteraceae bacterium]|nr:DNA replication and repair protein RecF [Solirubrobacteraceae bacterium]